jgi:hypothetical protein
LTLGISALSAVLHRLGPRQRHGAGRRELEDVPQLRHVAEQGTHRAAIAWRTFLREKTWWKNLEFFILFYLTYIDYIEV